MKLRDKYEVDALKALERKREVDEGAKLARSVDALRELKSAEERNLQKFHTDALARVQAEIDEKIQDLNHLKGEIEQARLQRQELQKPLTEEWHALRDAQDAFQKEKDELVQVAITFNAKQAELDSRKQAVINEEGRIADDKKRSEKLLQDASELHEQALHKEKLASQTLDDSTRESKEREERLTVREKQVAASERDIENIRKHLLTKEQSLETERIQVADMRRTLERALARLPTDS